MAKEMDIIKNQLNVKEKKLNEIESEFEKTKKSCDNFIKYKNERENLILENAKIESELKRTKYDLEECKNLFERQAILLKNREETINKLTEEISYLSFNTKKLKQDAERGLQDAIAYQQIVRKMEKELAENQIKREKVENELMIIKQQLGIGIKK
jgi:hypothetical protein